MLSLQSLQQSEYTIQLSNFENKITIKGELRIHTVNEYDELINVIVTGATKSNNDFVLDLSNLSFINSMGIAALGMTFINLKHHEKKIKILASKHIHWQYTSLNDLKQIKADIDIEYVIQH